MAKFTPVSFEAGLAALPDLLARRVRAHWEDFCIKAPAFAREEKDRPLSLPGVWAASEFVARTCVAHPTVLGELIAGGDLFRSYGSGEFGRRMAAATDHATGESELKAALRGVRRREMLRIAWRDLAGWAELEEVMAELSGLAEACIDLVLTRVFSWAVARGGRPLDEDGQEASMVVLGMGKLGGEELNFSSDIDLIFAYTGEGAVSGAQPVSNHEFFTRIGRSLIGVINDVTEDGFVFRVDMRLRPNGASGPLALSFTAMEQYYQAHGREWERYALIKARQVGGNRAAGKELLERLRPFVYRRYLDYGAIEAIRALKLMIERELLRKGAEQNIKLGPGGIREIEFIGQAFQLIRGGRETVLQERRIERVLDLLVDRGDLTLQSVADLHAAYRFLRRTENRLQMAEDRQTHSLPEDDDGRMRLAVAMGFPAWDSFYADLRRHMRKVHGHFEQVFVAPQGEAAAGDSGLASVWLETCDGESAAQLLRQAGFSDPPAVLEVLRALRQGRACNALSPQGRERLDRLMPLLLGADALSPDPSTTLARLVTLVEAIAQRSVYLSLLVENPMALSQLVRLCAASAWISDWISQHPILLDELIDPAALYAPLPRAALRAELQGRLARLATDDLEGQMEVLREFRHGHVLRVAAADVSPGLTAEEVGTHLADIAESVLEQALALANDGLEAKHGRPTCTSAGDPDHPGFAVIAYGKLGSRELGYGSDLDMIFLHDACAGQGVTDGARAIANEVFFARLAQRLIHMITTRTPGGILYQIDMRLRPSGGSGLLVTSMDAFREYQLGKAWTWEHQALMRARPVAGRSELRLAFEEVRREVLCQQRDPAQLRRDVAEMRARMRTAKAGRSEGLFDLKQDPGGMIDIEFMVQYWVLWRAHDYPKLIDQRDNVHVLEALASAGLLDAHDATVLVGAYRRYLSVEHRLKLLERRALVAWDDLEGFPERVLRIWRSTIEPDPAAV